MTISNSNFRMPNFGIAALCALCVLCGGIFSARAQTVVVVTNNVFDLQTVSVSASAGYFLLKVEARQADGSAIASGSATSALTLVDSVYAQPITTVGGTAESTTNCILSFFVPNLLAGTFTASAVVTPSDSPAYAVALLLITATNGASSGGGSTTLNVTNTTILNVTNITATTVYTSGVASVSGLTGAVTLATAGGLVVTTNGQTLVFSNTVTGGGGGGSLANQRSFEWRDAEGSLNVGWTKQLAAGLNLISARTATNDLTFSAYGTTASTTLQTNTLYLMFEHPVTGSIPWAVKSSQAVSSGLVIFTPKDGQNFDAAITQTLAAAGTLYVTNQSLTITAKTATVEVRIATTNAANLLQLGVDVQ